MSMMSTVALLAAGIMAGTLGGLLGIGGGIVLMPVLRFILALPPALAAGTCIVAVFFTTLGGSFTHHRLGHVDIRSLTPVAVAGGLSTCVFCLVFPYFSRKGNWLDIGVGLVFAFVSLRMIAEGLGGLLGKKAAEGDGNEMQGSLLQKCGIGCAAGVLPGLLGIGTGAVLVPAFTLILRAPIKTAMGSSLFCFAANAFVSSLFKFSQGFVDLRTAVPLSLGTLVGSNLGAMFNKRLRWGVLKVMFGVVFLYVSSKFIS
jgi:uncharacterized membrane protein YfcA